MLLTKLLALRLDALLLHSIRGAAAAAGFVTYLVWLWRWSQHVSPPTDLHARMGRLRFVMEGVRNQSALDAFRKAPSDGALGRAVRSRPQMLGVLLHAYQTTAWDQATRLDKLVRHFDQLMKLDWPDLIDPDMSLTIMPLHEIAPRLRLVLDQPPWFGGEGPLALNLFDDEERLYSIAFALREQDGLVTAHVGAIQGRALPGILEVYRQLTRAAHGLRPRDLLIELFRLFCAGVGIRRILLVSDSHRQHRDAYFGIAADAVMADYDTIWRERGARRVDDATFELPLHAMRRAAADVPPRKRGLYRQRYALLDTLAARMVQRMLALRRASAPLHPACEVA